MAVLQTVRDLCTYVLKTLNIVYDGRDPTPAELNGALYIVNEAFDSWNIDGQMIYARQFLTFPTDSSYQTNANGVYYTLGPVGSGASWIMPAGQDRPSDIEFVSFQLPTVPVVNKPCKVLTAQEWAAIRATQVISPIPNWIYMDEQYPITNVYVWPVPNGGSSLTFTFWQQLPTQLTLDSQVQLPPGYLKAIRLEAVMSYASFYNMPIKPEWASQYDTIKNNIKASNIQSNRLEYDVPAGPGVYDVLTDELY